MSEETNDVPGTGNEEPTKISDNHTVFVGSKPFMKFR